MNIQKQLVRLCVSLLALCLASCAMTKMQLQQVKTDAQTGKPVSAVIDTAVLPLMMFSDVITAPFQGMTPDQVKTIAQTVAPGSGSDPNAIVDTANAEGARMVAIGAANDAARQERIDAQRTQRTQSQHQEELWEQQQNATSQPNSGEGRAAGGAASDWCTDMNGYVTGKIWVGSDGIVAGSLTNTSNQPLSVHYTFAKGGQPDPNQAGVLTLQPGQTMGGEGSGIESSSSLIDIPPKIFWSAVLASDADKSCGMRNPWLRSDR
jgi:hypothetical protein